MSEYNIVVRYVDGSQAIGNIYHSSSPYFPKPLFTEAKYGWKTEVFEPLLKVRKVKLKNIQ